MSEIRVLVGCGFDQKGPYLELDQYNGSLIHRERVQLIGRTFSLTAFSNRYCTGSFDLKLLEGLPCKDGTKLDAGTNNSCYPCFEKTGFNPSFYHMQKSDISPQQRDYNNTKHAVYLAYFSERLIKVGISSDKRKEVRWLEQGARFVAHIMTCENAYEARHNEELISKSLTLPEVVLGKKKRSILTFSIDDNQAKNALTMVIEKIRFELNLELYSNRVFSFESIYNPNSIKLDRTIIDLTDEKESKISGKFIALYGDILVVENAQKQFMYSLKKMIGHQIKLEDGEEKLDFQPQQIAMF